MFMWQEHRRISNNSEVFDSKLSLHFLVLFPQTKSLESSRSLFTVLQIVLEEEIREEKHGLAEVHVSITFSVTLETISESCNFFFFSDLDRIYLA